MPTRRQLIQQASLLIGARAAAALGLGVLASGTQAAAARGWHMPDEGAPQARAFIAFGAQDAIWEDFTADVQAALGRIARAIAAHQPVTVFCRARERNLAERHCGADNVSFVETRLDDIWMRDIGANFVLDGRGSATGVDFNFNGWGNKQRHAADAKIAAETTEVTDTEYLQSELVGEGGGIEVDGRGTGIMTESSWINANRNPGWSKAEVEEELKRCLGLRKIIWLPGIMGRDITDAHVDFYARFARPGVVVANLDMDPESYDYALTRKHLEILRRATDADGKPLEIHTMSPPLNPRRSKFLRDNPDFAAGYINYFVINGAVIAPEFGDAEADAKARDLLARLYPGRKVVQLDIDAIASGGGGIHCVTNQLPVA
ncbi:agmatine deiminase family protein [Achromobacter xylosoxidans]|uniref:agmatine deiminase family protein n=1 Tax=Alcaligenes xylosoxydans xylosoxydans TaxID=85698 RepID=UPI000B49204D|nr:agmatine deiminase family protein [Achromobacter xylosoxidans]